MLKRTLQGAAALAAIFLGVWWARELASVDPFANFRRDRQTGQRTAVELANVAFWNYQGGELTATGKVEKVNVREDRQQFEFLNVSKGRYQGEKGEFEFESPRATWNAVTKRLEADRGVRLSNKDMALSTASFTYREETGELEVPGTIRGRLFDGEIEAEGLVYAMVDDSYTTGAIVWEGDATPFAEMQGEQKPTHWTFKTDGVSSHKGDVQTFLNGEATDGEVIVKAPKLERNLKTDVVTATGRVFYFSKKANLVCDKAVIYRKEKRAVLTGNVDMLVKPEDAQKLAVEEIPPFRPMVPDEVAKGRPSPPEVQKSEAQKQLDEEVRSTGTGRKYPMSLTSAQIEYWYGEGQRRAVITGAPQAMQQLAGERWRYVWAFRAEYDGEAERLKMFAAEGKDDLRMKTSLGDDVTARWVDLSTKEGEDDWTAMGLKGDLYPDEDEIPKTGDPPPPLRGPIGANRPPPPRR